MATNGKIRAASPGLIKIECPEEGCGDVHRIPVNISYEAHLEQDGALNMTIHSPDPDLSKFRDHMVFEHGRF